MAGCKGRLMHEECRSLLLFDAKQMAFGDPCGMQLVTDSIRIVLVAKTVQTRLPREQVLPSILML